MNIVKQDMLCTIFDAYIESNVDASEAAQILIFKAKSLESSKAYLKKCEAEMEAAQQKIKELEKRLEEIKSQKFYDKVLMFTEDMLEKKDIKEMKEYYQSNISFNKRSIRSIYSEIANNEQIIELYTRYLNCLGLTAEEVVEEYHRLKALFLQREETGVYVNPYPDLAKYHRYGVCIDTPLNRLLYPTRKLEVVDDSQEKKSTEMGA